MKHKLPYIVTQQVCLDPTTGAYQHISIGIRELGRCAEVVPFIPQVKQAPQAGVSRKKEVPQVSGVRPLGI